MAKDGKSAKGREAIIKLKLPALRKLLSKRSREKFNRSFYSFLPGKIAGSGLKTGNGC
jgi:hypothetical protein